MSDGWQTKFEQLQAEIEELHAEYRDEASDTLGDDMHRYGETQGACEAMARLRTTIDEIRED